MNVSVDVRFSEPGHVAVNSECDAVPHPPLAGRARPRVAVTSLRLDPRGRDVHSYTSTAARDNGHKQCNVTNNVSIPAGN